MWILLPLAGGYIAASFLPAVPVLAPAGASVIFAAAGIVASYSSHRHSRLAWAVLFIIGASLCGCAYHLLQSDPSLPHWRTLPPREAVVDMRVLKRFDSSDRYGRVSGVARITRTRAHLADLVGHKVFFRLNPRDTTRQPTRSDVLQVRGVLTYLDALPDSDSFSDFLRQSDVHLSIQRGAILREDQSPHPLFHLCRNLAGQFETILRLGGETHPEYANIYVAMLLGRKSVLSREQKDRYLASGTMHLFAISGLHVGVVAITLSAFFTLLRLPSKLSATIALSLLFFYVVITGAAPSAIRAYLMVFFYWTSRAFLRQPAPFSALVASAIAVLILDPSEIRSAGFRLSYSVVAAILLYGVPLADTLTMRIEPFAGLPPQNWTRLHKFAVNRMRNIAALFSISLAAILASTPLTIHYFEIFTPGALFLNMVLVPLASLLVTCGVISLLLGITQLPIIAEFLNHSAWVVLSLMDALIRISVKIPGYFSERQFLHPFLGPLLLVVLLAIFLFGNVHAPAVRKWRFAIAPSVLLAAVALATTGTG